MNQLIKKIYLIFVPFLLLTIATVGIYTLLHWFLFIKTTIFSVDEEIIDIFVPIAIPAIPILIWLRPRIKLLDLKSKKNDPLSGYIMVAWFAMIAPNMIAQAYLVTATGKLTKLNNISEIDRVPKTKYYASNTFYVDKRLVRAKATFEISGRYNEHFDMAIYSVCPVFDKDHSVKNFRRRDTLLQKGFIKKALIVLDGKIVPNSYLSGVNPNSVISVYVLKGAAAKAIYGDAARYGAVLIKTNEIANLKPPAIKEDENSGFAPVAWIALKFQKTISNRLSPDEKENRYKEFAKESQKGFDSKRLDDFTYLDRIGPSKDRKNYILAINTKNNSTNGDPIILSPAYGPFEARNGEKLPWIFGSLGIGAFVFMIILLFKPLKKIEENEDDVAMRQPSKWKDIDIFLPRKGYFVTPVIIDVNLIIYLIMVCAGLGFVSFNGPDLLKWGANYRPFVTNGQYWRLLTNIFLHGGLMHVLFNMYGLLFVSIFLEPLIGGKKFALFYLFSGIMASLASIWWHPATISIGASGAIFGIYGVFFALLTTKLFPAGFKKPFLINISVFIGCNLLFGIAGGIDNAAHIGGLVTGLICGYAIYPSLKNKSEQIEPESETHQLSDKV